MLEDDEKMTAADNISIFEAARAVPGFAKKAITGGRLNRMTNISPMWRIEKLTELFGPCGFGWWVEGVRYWTSEAAGETAVWCELSLRVRHGGEVSQPIHGIGGSKLCGKGQGDGINDEAYKMAETDAMSVACKNLGIGADVYYGTEDGKHERTGTTARGTRAAAPSPAKPAEGGVTLEQAIAEVNAARTAEELTRAWNEHKGQWGGDSRLKRAVADSPANPRRRAQ